MWKILICTILVVVCKNAIAQNPLSSIEDKISVPVPADLGSYVPKPQTVHPSIATSNYYNHFNQLSQKEQHQQIMREVEEHQAKQNAHQQRVRELIDEAVNTPGKPAINYAMKGRNIPGREYFYKAFTQLKDMLDGKQPLSIKKSVFLSEYAYDPTLSWEAFDKSIKDMAAHLGYYMQNNDLHVQDNRAKNLAIFKFFTDTLSVNHPSKERPIVSYPLLYDFDDFWGREDVTKQFISKLISEGTGQCHSLPLLYLILAEEMDAEAHLAFAPSHSYIKIQDEYGDWYNIELTTHSLTSDQFIMQTGFVKSSAIQSNIYMNPLSEKEVVAQCLNDLAMNYTKKFGYEDFVLNCAWSAYESGLKSVSTHMLIHNYYQNLYEHIVNQYQYYGLSQKDLARDEKANNIFTQMIGSQKHLEKLGYADMPPDMYEAWLKSVEEEAQKQEHRNRMRTLLGTN